MLRPDGRVTLGLVAQQQPRLSESAQWAHVHEVDGHEPIARIVAPPRSVLARLPGTSTTSPNTEYVACLVPAFTADGRRQLERHARRSPCDLYDCWTFRTGPQGDFPELAAKLHKADLAANRSPAASRSAAPRSRTDRAPPGENDDRWPPPARCGCRRRAAAPDPADAAPAPRSQQEVARCRRASSPRTAAAWSRRPATMRRSRTRTRSTMRRRRLDRRSCAAIRGCAAPPGLAPGTRSSGRIGSPTPRPRKPATSRSRVTGSVTSPSASKLSRSLWRRRLPADPVDRLAVLARRSAGWRRRPAPPCSTRSPAARPD